MRTRERPQRGEEQHSTPALPSGSGEGGALGARADALLQAFDDAIDRALSPDSDRFLAENRQQGGQ